MWSPTHVQVVVLKAKSLLIKGKHGANDAFVTIQLGKEKYQTSVKEKSENPEWNEECELTIPDGNTSKIVLTVLHRNFVGLDKFLGHVQIPLNELDIYENSRSRWYSLHSKPGKNDTKNRGELEVKIAFIVKSMTGSLMDLSKKPKKTGSLPLKMVHSVGGSLINLASKEKKLVKSLPFKNIANYGHKLSEKFPGKNKSKHKNENRIEENEGDAEQEYDNISHMSINSEEEFSFTSSLDRLPTMPEEPSIPDKPPRRVKEQEETDEWAAKLLGNQAKGASERSWSVNKVPKAISESPEEELLQTEAISPVLPEKSRKLRMQRNNIRRHTVDGLGIGKLFSDMTKPVTVSKDSPEPVKKEEKQQKEPPKALPPSDTSVVPTLKPSSSCNQLPSTPFTASSVARRSSLSNNSPSVNNISVPVTTSAALTTTAPTSSPVVTSSPVRLPAGKENLRIESSKLLSNLSKEKLEMFEKMNKEELVELILCQQSSIDTHLKQIRELEEYIDNLLVRVMETTPRLLQTPYKLSASIRKLIYPAQERAWTGIQVQESSSL